MLAVVAMSGGVDSSVAAALTAEERGPGSVVGIALRLTSSPDSSPGSSAEESGQGAGLPPDAARKSRSCCAPDDLLDARRAAATAGIRFFVYDAQERFRAEVIDPFVAAYARGETPNPCVRCNDHVKFDWLLSRARRLGADSLVTGHYARIEQREGRFALLRAADAAKDQSYFLHGLTQEALSLVRFPLGQMTKTEVRAQARARGLPNADKPESMEVCFVGGAGLGGYLEGQGIPAARGEIVDLAGRPVGEHAGIHRFTVGQRRGLGVSGRLPLYVAALDAGRQRVVVGTRDEVAQTSFSARQVTWTQAAPGPLAERELQCEVQLRHRGQPLAARLCPEGDSVRVELRAPAVGVAPGQSAVFYRGDEVLGGGIIG